MLRLITFLCGFIYSSFVVAVDTPFGEITAPFGEEDPELNAPNQKVAPTAFAADEPRPVPGWGQGDGKSYGVPALNIVLFDSALNVFDRIVFGGDDFDVTPKTIYENLTGGWVYDNDPFAINQFGHPYQGSMYHGFARAAGHDYWTSSAYTFVGSLFWEIAGEATPPSVNDQFTTGFGGSFLGEPLFRMASLLLETQQSRPGFWTELAVAAISPATGYTRWRYGDRFDGVFRSRNPAVYTHVTLGANVSSNVVSNVNLASNPDESPVPQSYEEGSIVADFKMEYGLPGKPGYNYTRPFDYFQFQFTATPSNIFENILVRGLLKGQAYSVNENHRGVWGLYGVYQYIAPQIFRVSMTGAGIGTTNQFWLSEKLALQGTGLLALGYGSAGTIRAEDERDYHNGLAGEALLSAKLVYGDRWSFQLAVRDFYVTDYLSEEKNGSEKIMRAEAELTFRIHNLHAISLKYVESERQSEYANFPDSDQRVGAFNISYTLLGQSRAGAVDWRAGARFKE